MTAIARSFQPVAAGTVAGAIGGVGVLVWDVVSDRLCKSWTPTDVPGANIRVPLLLHVAHGATWGALHGAAVAAGLAPRTAVVWHTAAMATSDAVVLSGIGLTDAPWDLDRADLSNAAIRTAVHSVATALVLALLIEPRSAAP